MRKDIEIDLVQDAATKSPAFNVYYSAVILTSPNRRPVN